MEIFCARQHLDYRNKEQIAELGHWFRDSELKMHSLHRPCTPTRSGDAPGRTAVITITEPVKGQRLKMVDEIKRALEIAEVIPFRYLIQHIGVGGEEFDLRKFDAAFCALEELSLFARQRGVEILLENIPNELSSAERLLQFDEITHLGLELRVRHRPRQHERGRGAGFPPDEGRASAPRTSTTTTARMTSTCSPCCQPGGTIDWRNDDGIVPQLRRANSRWCWN